MNDYEAIIYKHRAAFRSCIVYGGNSIQMFKYLPDFIKVVVGECVDLVIDNYVVLRVSIDCFVFNDDLTEHNKMRIAKVIDKALSEYRDSAAYWWASPSNKTNSTINAALGDK